MSATIQPASIPLLSLPWVPISNLAALPLCAAIYFVVNSGGTVLYIGRAQRLQSRWKVHHRLGQAQALGEGRLTWLQVDDPALLPDIERACIDYFQPPWNRSRKAGRNSPLTQQMIGRRLRQARRAQDVTQETLSTIADVSQQTISRLESGKATHVEIMTVYALAVALNVSLDWLCHRTERCAP